MTEEEKQDHEKWLNSFCGFCGKIRRYCMASGIFREEQPVELPPTRWPEGAEL